MTETKGYFGGIVNPRYLPSEYQEIINLNNGYSLSIIKGRVSFGQWEAAVINNRTDDLDYDTDLTYDVIRFRTDDEVREFIARAFTMDSNGKLPQ